MAQPAAHEASTCLVLDRARLAIDSVPLSSPAPLPAVAHPVGRRVSWPVGAANWRRRRKLRSADCGRSSRRRRRGEGRGGEVLTPMDGWCPAGRARRATTPGAGSVYHSQVGGGRPAICLLICRPVPRLFVRLERRKHRRLGGGGGTVPAAAGPRSIC